MTTPAAIESHVAAVRRKMILQRFVRRFALTLLVLGAAVWGIALALRLFSITLPGGPWLWIGGGVILAAAVAYAMALRNAPTRHDAAVAIDDRLGLKEKFSTALAFSGSDDVFAGLAVADAGRAAGHVSLRKKFPIAWPKTYYGVPLWALLILLTLWLVPALDFSSQAVAQAETKAQIDEKANAEVEQIVKNGMDALAVLPPEVAEREELRVAKDQLAKARDDLGRDPAGARQTAKEAQEKLAEAIKEQIDRGEKYAQAKEDAKTFRNLTPPEEETGPVADAHRAMADADFQQAIADLGKTVDNFDKMTQAEKEQAADQMQQLAKALQNAPNSPQAQQQAQQQLQQMGMSQQQAQQAQQLAQQAAQGSQQAQQQLQQMAQQATAQMNNGQGATPQQQQQMQQAMQQAQQQAQSGATAQQMSQMAQQMAQAMQQAAQQGQGQPQQGQQGQPQQGQGQQQAQGGQGQQPQPGQGQQPQPGQGQQAGGQQGQQQMQGAGQQMQNALAQMQAVQQDAQQMQAAQQMAQGGQQGGQGQGQGQGQQAGAGQPGGQQPGQQGGQQGQGNQPGGQQQANNAPMGQWQPGQAQGQGAGMGGGPGQGAGGQAGFAPAPFTFKQEVSQSHDDESGRVIASSLIKADAIKGESRAQVQEIVESETQEATDEVDQQRVSRQAQQAVKQYFQSMAKDAGAAKPQSEPN